MQKHKQNSSKAAKPMIFREFHWPTLARAMRENQQNPNKVSLHLVGSLHLYSQLAGAIIDNWYISLNWSFKPMH